jgi:hypothetical protein
MSEIKRLNKERLMEYLTQESNKLKDFAQVTDSEHKKIYQESSKELDRLYQKIKVGAFDE